MCIKYCANVDDDNLCQVGFIWMRSAVLSSPFIRLCPSGLGSLSSTGSWNSERHWGVALFGFSRNSCYGRMAGRIWEEEKQRFFTEVGKYYSSVNEISVNRHLLPKKFAVLEK